MRPSPDLGFDRDQVALHLMHCEAYELAASQFRRAVWLNPYEKTFKVHLADCLYRMGQYPEAREWVVKAIEQDPDNADYHKLLDMIDQRVATP